MAYVSLIVLDHLGSPDLDRLSAAWGDALERAGHRVEILAIGPVRSSIDRRVRAIAPAERGIADDAIEGLRKARGDFRLVIDASRPYRPQDLVRVLEPLIAGRAEIAVAAGRLSGRRAVASMILRPLVKTCDPFTGLIGLKAETFERAVADFRPVGRRFALEILAKADGERIDVAVEDDRLGRAPNLGIDDLRHIKRIADDRLGNVSRLIQFCVVGASGMVVDLSFYALFQWIFGRTWMADRPTPIGDLDLAVAGSLSIALALTWNFTLNRRLTFSDARKGSLPRQFVTYVLSNALGIALSLALRLTLPRHVGFFARHRLYAAVVGIVTATGISFSMSRWLVFRAKPAHRSDRPASVRSALVEAPVAPACAEVA